MATRSDRRSRNPEGCGRVCACATGNCTIFSLVGPFDRKWRHQTSPVVTPEGSLEGCAHAQPEVAQYSPWLGPFHRKWRHQTSPVGLPLEVTWSEVPLGCSLGRPCPISRMATGTSPFTGYLPLSRHFIFIITFLTKVCCFRICCVVLQGCPRPVIFPPFSWGAPSIMVFTYSVFGYVV